jgi:hypothetical protein
MSNKPKKWTDVYPQGTKDGDEEQRFFIALARHKQYTWRSVASLVKESKLSKERVEQIIQKYYKKNMVFANPNSEDQWGYWERNPEMLNSDKKSIAASDQKKRIDKASP